MVLLSLINHNELGHQVLKCKADIRVQKIESET